MNITIIIPIIITIFHQFTLFSLYFSCILFFYFTLAATGVHDTSSRSHAILRIYIQRNKAHTREEEDSSIGSHVPEGVLTLVDLAGSEHRIDSMYHSADRRKEGAGTVPLH